MKKALFSILILISLMLGVNVYAQDARTIVRVPALMYHSVDDEVDELTISPENFRLHLKTIIENGYTPVTVEELVAFVDKGEALPEKPVCITFDDGYLDNYMAAFPILDELGAKATMYVIGSSVGKELYKDTSYRMNPHFDYDQAQEMIDSGLVSIQSHTYDMHQWPEFEKETKPRENIMRFAGEKLRDYLIALDSDINMAKSLLETETTTSVMSFAYPIGKHNGIAELVMKKNGIRVTMATSTGPNYIKHGDVNSLYSLNRYDIHDAISPEQLLIWLDEK